ncbi:Oxalate decarboxylase [Mycena sanguinolenta]|uniref:Oxalate decarboxylase n=1 Tax=Mycena sanguinolenta TaxID=230812 RepID=A0A8H6ZG18_9AGAR|nr:Oxalate decarboxylase [Mycena sanguinolenta]
MLSLVSCLCALYLAGFASPAPASSAPAVSSELSVAPPASSSIPDASSTASAAEPTATVPFASTDSNSPLWSPESGDPAPIRGSLGATLLGPSNLPMEQENPDLLAPPTSDNGDVSNAKWPFAMSHNRLQTGGWARQQNIEVLPIATCVSTSLPSMSTFSFDHQRWPLSTCASKRVQFGNFTGIKPQRRVKLVLFCHVGSFSIPSQWAYVISGSTQVSAVDSDGRNFLATVGPGDLWFFPPGIPHSLQATNDSAEGSEFLLIFDDGAFSEDSTFLLTDWLAHVPAEVIQKNFQANPDAFSHIPAKELYIFPGTPPANNAVAPSSPQGEVTSSYSFAMSQMNATQLSGGTVRIVDSTVFPVSTTIAAAEVTVNPGAIRELHVRGIGSFPIGKLTETIQWHPTMDEWSFFLEGQGRVTIFASQGNARTFNYQAGDIGFVPTAMGHYVENTGNTTLRYLEIFNTDKFQDISLNQWLALTPPALVKAHLQLSDETIASLSKTKPVVVG